MCDATRISMRAVFNYCAQ